MGMAALALSTILFTGCDKEDLMDMFPHLPDDKGEPAAWDVINFEQYETGFLTQVESTNGAGPYMVMGMRREMGGAYAEGNHAMVFNTQTPTGDDTDLYTGVGKIADLGKVLIINQDMESTPNDNQYGGMISLDFSSMGGATLHDITVVDIDAYEDMSYVRLYGHNGKMLLEKKIHPMGNNTVQVVDLGATKGVMRLEVVLDGENGGMPAGSGAVDNIRFSR